MNDRQQSVAFLNLHRLRTNQLIGRRRSWNRDLFWIFQGPVGKFIVELRNRIVTCFGYDCNILRSITIKVADEKAGAWFWSSLTDLSKTRATASATSSVFGGAFSFG